MLISLISTIRMNSGRISTAGGTTIKAIMEFKNVSQARAHAGDGIRSQGRNQGVRRVIAAVVTRTLAVTRSAVSLVQCLGEFASVKGTQPELACAASLPEF